MKKLLTTAMILGTVLVIDAAQPADAAVTAPVVSSTDQSQVTPTWWRNWSWHSGGPGLAARPGYHHYFWRSWHHWR